MADKAAEHIKYQTERLRFLCLLAVAIGGGSLSLLLGTMSLLRLGLAILGLLATVVFTVMSLRQDRRILALDSRARLPARPINSTLQHPPFAV